MANKNAPFGFRTVKTKDGHTTAKLGMYFIPATDGTAVGIGDLVKLAGSADSQFGYPTVTKAAAGDTVVGTVVGFQFNPDNLMQIYRPASQDRYVFVSDDPDVILEAQADGSIVATDIGLNIDFNPGTVSTVTGRTSATVAVATKAATATLPFQIISLSTVSGNEFGNYAVVQLKFNKHQYANATAGV